MTAVKSAVSECTDRFPQMLDLLFMEQLTKFVRILVWLAKLLITVNNILHPNPPTPSSS